MPKRTSKPAAELRDALAEQQVEVSTRKLERRGTAGLLPSSVSAHTADRAAAAEALLEREKIQDRAVLVMFLEGNYPVERDRLERAYRDFFGRATKLISRYAGGPATYDFAVGLAARLARKSAKSGDYRDLRRRLKLLRQERFVTVLSLLEEYYLELLHVLLTGRTSSDAGMEDLLEGMGAAAAAREHLADLRPPVDRLPLSALREVFSELSLPSALRNLSRASAAELERARSDAQAVWEYTRAVAPVLQRVHGLPDAFGLAAVAALPKISAAAAVPGLLMLNRLLPANLEWWRRHMTETTPRFRAMNTLLDQLPARLHRGFADKASLTKLPLPDQQELKSLLARFQRDHPAEFDLILQAEMPANR